MNTYGLNKTIFQDYADVITVPELAKMLRIGCNSAYDLANSGKLQVVKVGNQIRIPNQVC